MDTAKTNFYRVLLNLKRSDVHRIDDQDGYFQSDDIFVILNEKINRWHVEFHSINDRVWLYALIQEQLKDETNDKIVNVYIQSRNLQIQLESHKKDHCNGWNYRHEYRWTKNKDPRLLTYDELTQIDIVLNVRTKDEIKKEVETLQSLSAKAAMETLQGDNYMDNVLDYLDLAVTLKAQLLEDKCLSLILLSYNNLKLTEKWKNLRPSLKNKIVDLFYETPNQIVSIKLVEIDDDESEPDEREQEELEEMMHDLEFHSDDESESDNDFEAF